MMKKSVKWIAALGAISALGAGFSFGAECGVPMHSEPCGFLPCSNPEPFQGPAMFAAKGCETRKITIGGNITTQYQFVDVNDEINELSDPEEYNNFLMAHIRLSVLAELGEGWSGYMNLDFAGEPHTIYSRANINGSGSLGLDEGEWVDRFCECRDQRSMYVDQAWIQKVWLDATFRVGYQKVNFVAENNTPEPYLKTIERSVATNFFTNLGRRAVSGNAGNWTQPGNANLVRPNFAYTGERLGDRHVGVFVAGQAEAFHYSGAITSGYQGLCMHSERLNSSLNFYASLAYEFGIDEVDFLIGVNGAYSDKGTNLKRSKNLNVYGVNPYVFANWKCLSFMGEFMYGHVDAGNITKPVNNDSDPWGFNAIGSYMLNDCWELVGRFSYVNSDDMGMTIGDTFGCAPDEAKQGANQGNGISRISSDTIFEKVYAGYVGVNWYLMNGAIKISAGLEQAKYKNRFNGTADDGSYGTFSNNDSNIAVGTSATGGNTSNNKGAKVNSARGQIQFLF